MSETPVRIRATKIGGAPRFELVVDGTIVREVTYFEIIEMALQFISSLRWQK